MFFLRRFGKILRGRATPFQILVSGVLAGALAFQPGLGAAPGIVASLLILLVILNGSLPFAFVVWAPAKLLSLALMSLSFQVGGFLIDGPTKGFWTWLVNAPVFAWFGFDNYVASGGLVLGTLFGFLAGLLGAWLLRGMRMQLASLEENSEKYKQFTSKPWVRVLLFVFVGGSHGKKSWKELSEQRVGNPIRITGVIVAVIVCAGLWFAQKQLSTPILTRELRSGLERMNGATVDLGKAELALEEGRVTVADLALADPDKLDHDLFQSASLEADASLEDFARKRLRVEKILVRGASSGTKRTESGKRLTPPSQPSPEPEAGEGKTLDDYLAQFEQWRDRLRKAREWMEKVSKKKDQGAPAGEEEREEGLRERLEREARENGWAAVRASHRIEDAPALLISDTSVEEFTIASIPGEVFDVHAKNLSTDPELAPASPSLEIASRSGNVRFAVDMNASNPSAGAPGLALTWKGIPGGAIAAQLKTGGKPILDGGTVDLELAGGWSEGRVGHIDLPLRVTVHGSTLNLGDLGSTVVQSFALPIHLSGPLDALRVGIDTEELANALREAGAKELEGKLRAKLGELEGKAKEQLDEAKKKVEDELQEEVGEKAKGLLDGVIGGKKKKGGG